MGRTFLVLAVIGAFVLGSIVTGTIVYADDDDKKGNPLKKIVKLLQQILTAIEEQGVSTSQGVITIITVDLSGGGIPGIPTTFKQSGVTLQTGVSPEIFFATNGETYEVFLDIFEDRNFIQWSDGSTANPRTFSVTSDRTFTGVYTPPPPPPKMTVFVDEQDVTTIVGAQIVKVVVNDADLKDTDEAESEPDVIVNGQKLRMVQETDGNWYGYLADTASALITDSGVVVPGTGLDFGLGCTSISAIVGVGLSSGSFSATEGVFIPDARGFVGDTGSGILETCVGGASTGLLNNVITGAQTPSGPALVPIGQIGIDLVAWPLIQLYSFNSDDGVMIQYNAGGEPPEVITLNFIES